MTHIIVKVFENFGYILLANESWRKFQGELLNSKAAEQELASQLKAMTNQLMEERKATKREFAAAHPEVIKLNRAEARILALKRQRDGLQADLVTCRDRLLRADSSGRTQELEGENRNLNQRLADLSVYLEETRKTGVRR